MISAFLFGVSVTTAVLAGLCVVGVVALYRRAISGRPGSNPTQCIFSMVGLMVVAVGLFTLHKTAQSIIQLDKGPITGKTETPPTGLTP
ncbi:MAG: hypothetical protein ACRC7O_15385 [Fimbriiglobus sp.]